MKRESIALGGILALVLGVGVMAWVTRACRFPLPWRVAHPPLLYVQVPHSDAELAGLLQVEDPKNACPQIRKRLLAGLGWDNVFPFCYGVCFLSIAWFVTGGRLPSKRVNRFAALAAAAILLTIALDYRENSHTIGVLANACEAGSSHAEIDAMSRASLGKWGGLGLALLLLGIACVGAPRIASREEEAGDSFDTYSSIRALAAIVGGACGIGAFAFDVVALAAIEFNAFSIVVLATLWQAIFLKRGGRSAEEL